MASVWGGVRSIDRGGGSLVGLWAAESQCTEEAGWEEEDRGGILKGGHGDSVVTSHVHTLQSSLVLCVHTGVSPPPPISSQKLLFSLGGSFLYYADHFKLYSGFCANHIKVQKVLERGTTHILIFCIVTRNSMQKQTKFSFRAPVLRQRKLGRSRLKVRSSLLGSKSIMYESKCPRVRRWVKARWAMPLQFSTSPAPSPAPRTKEHTALHLSVCDRHFQSIIALFSSNRWCLNKYMHI